MATFTSVTRGARALSTHVQQIIDSWTGISGTGVAFENIAVNDSTKYSGDFRNLDATNGYVLRARDELSATIVTMTRTVITFGKKLVATLGEFTAAADMISMTATWNAAVTFNGILMTITNTSSATASRLLKLVAGTGGATTVLSVDTLGQVMIGTDTLNTNMTVGITIDQSTNDNEILTLKSSTDVTHGMTDVTQTETFGYMAKYSATDGGLKITGLADTNSVGLRLVGISPTDDTTKVTGAVAPIELAANKKNTTTTQDVGVNGNLLVIQNGSTTRFIFDAEGSAHADVEWIAFDDYDDVALLTDFEQAMVAKSDPVKAGFVDFLRYNHDDLERAGIVHFDRDNPGHAMVNQTKLSMLLVGGLRQVAARSDARLAALEQELADLRRLVASSSWTG